MGNYLYGLSSARGGELPEQRQARLADNQRIIRAVTDSTGDQLRALAKLAAATGQLTDKGPAYMTLAPTPGTDPVMTAAYREVFTQANMMHGDLVYLGGFEESYYLAVSLCGLLDTEKDADGTADQVARILDRKLSELAIDPETHETVPAAIAEALYALNAIPLLPQAQFYTLWAPWQALTGMVPSAFIPPEGYQIPG